MESLHPEFRGQSPQPQTAGRAMTAIQALCPPDCAQYTRIRVESIRPVLAGDRIGAIAA